MKTKQLYKIAKYAYKEAFLQSQMEMAGSQQSRVMDQMEKNRRYVTIQDLAMKIMITLYIGGMVFMPIISYNSIKNAIIEGIPMNRILFAGSMTTGMFFILQLVFLIVFGMFFASGILSGEAFKFLSTLPLKKNEIQKIILMAFFRGNDAPFFALLFVFPVATFIITHSPLLFLISLVISTMNVIFSFGLLVLVGERVHRVMATQDTNSRKATFIRISVMMSYLVVTMIVSMGIFFVGLAIEPLFTTQNSFIDGSNVLNYIISLISFPFSGSYLIITLYSLNVGSYSIPWQIIATSLIGLLIFALITWRIYKKALRVLSNIIVPKPQGFSPKERINPIEESPIKILPPIQAFFKKDKQSATRDMQMMMTLFMPIFLPLTGLLMVVFMEDLPEKEIIITLFSMNIGYIMMSGVLMVYGLLNADTTGASILASLPIITRDVVKSKFLWLYIFLPFGTLFPVVFFIGNPNFDTILSISLALVPIGPISGVLTLLLKVRLFGKLKYKYVLEEVKIRYKIWKWILISVINMAFYFVILIFMIFKMEDNQIWSFILILLSGEAIFVGILFYFFNRMFPKPPNRFNP